MSPGGVSARQRAAIGAAGCAVPMRSSMAAEASDGQIAAAVGLDMVPALAAYPRDPGS